MNLNLMEALENTTNDTKRESTRMTDYKERMAAQKLKTAATNKEANEMQKRMNAERIKQKKQDDKDGTTERNEREFRNKQWKAKQEHEEMVVKLKSEGITWEHIDYTGY